MSWSVSAFGKPAEVKEHLEKRFAYPLADGTAGLPDAGEKETVRLIKEMINQCLDTFDPEKTVKVTAYGHMAHQNWETKEGACQSVYLTIEP
jgi:hypothetical protein